MKALKVTRVDELRVELTFTIMGDKPVTLWDLEQFAAALRMAGAPGSLAITARQTAIGPMVGPIALEAVHLKPTLPGGRDA